MTTSRGFECPCGQVLDVVGLLELDHELARACVCAEHGCEGATAPPDPRQSLLRAGAWALVDALRTGVHVEWPSGAADEARGVLLRRREALELLAVAYREEGLPALLDQVERDLRVCDAGLVVRPVRLSVPVLALLAQLGLGPEVSRSLCCQVTGCPASAFGPLRMSGDGTGSAMFVLGLPVGSAVAQAPADVVVHGV